MKIWVDYMEGACPQAPGIQRGVGVGLGTDAGDLEGKLILGIKRTLGTLGGN